MRSITCQSWDQINTGHTAQNEEERANHNANVPVLTATEVAPRTRLIQGIADNQSGGVAGPGAEWCGNAQGSHFTGQKLGVGEVALVAGAVLLETFPSRSA